MPVLFSFSNSTNNKTSVEAARSKNRKWLERKPAKGVSTFEKEIPSDEFPEGWTVQYHRRSDRNRVDRYWFSPRTKKRFRSKVGVAMFIKKCEEVGGDEERALSAIKSHLR